MPNTWKTRIESIPEISKVEIRGVDEREIRVNVDLLKLEAYELTFDDIEFAIAQENVSISGGEIKAGRYQKVGENHWRV